MPQLFQKNKKSIFFRPRLFVKSRLQTLEKIKNRTRISDPFGNIIFFKRVLTSMLGIGTYHRFNIINKTQVKGAEYLQDLPETNVLFVSNHQTYFADVIALYHVFSGAKWKQENIDSPRYLLSPRVKSYYIAAEETMNSGFLPKLFAYAGAVTVKRSWRSAGEDVRGNSDFRAPSKIKKALDFGWVIAFPQGTTNPAAPVRKGAANMIKKMRPLIVPVTLNGFSDAFQIKGLGYRQKGTQLSISFGPPIQFEESVSVQEIQSFLENHLIK